MKPKFKNRDTKERLFDVAEAVGWAVDRCVWYHDSDVRELQRKQEKLIELVGFLFEQLPDDKAALVAEALGYDWEVVE